MNFTEFVDTVYERYGHGEDALRHLHDHLLASGVDPGAVLRGEAKAERQLLSAAGLRGLAEGLFPGATISVEMATDENAGQYARIRQLELSLSNVLGLAQKLRSEAYRKKLTMDRAAELAGHFMRFCLDAGVSASILRDAEPSAPPALTELRELAHQWATLEFVEWEDLDAEPDEVAFDCFRQAAEQLTAALDAMGAKK